MVNHKAIAEKWQKKWESAKVFQVSEDSKKKKFYVLEMYPYPSAAGLHMGHALNYTIGDIYARFKRMQDFNVLYPMGFDSFGLPAENAAIEAKSHPKKFTENAIKNYLKQMKGLGLSYDWSRLVETHKPDYYKWDQWIFLQMYKKGLVYKKKSSVNWCPDCNTVLANEQVHNGKCWRHTEIDVVEKELSQWFLKITEYAEELYDSIDKLDGWPELIKTLQRNWISKKEWIDIEYNIDGSDKKLSVSTTRPDTNFGATFIVISPEHPLLSTLVPEDKKGEVEEYIKYAKSKTEEERMNDKAKKTGVFAGFYCLNQLTNEKMPVWIADFVLMKVGTGVVVGVPGHDLRDFDFAKQYKLPIKRVVVGPDGDKSEITRREQVQEDEGTMINSDFLNGLDIHKATKKIMDYMEKKKWGKRIIRYRLHDWLISRQRYWGTPIPIYYDNGEPKPVDEKDLPIVLPEDVTFKKGIGNPLETSKKYLYKGYKLETDTMDTFANSSWYFLRYCDPNNDKQIFDKEKANYWCPVDQYIGGKEHACMHLIYIRFYTKFLRDLGLLNFDEPAKKLFNQGMLQGADGFKMSKSRGNVVVPETVSQKFGLDAARLFLVSVASPDKDIHWSDQGAEGASRFLNRIFNFAETKKFGKTSARLLSKLHQTIRDYSEDIKNMQYNLATIKLRELFESFGEGVAKKDFESFVKMLAPICPHSAEELWEIIGNKPFVSLEKWPSFNEKLIDEKLDFADKYIQNLKSDVTDVLRLIKVQEPKQIKLILSPKWKYEFVKQFKKAFTEHKDFGTISKKFMSTDLKKHGKEIMKLIPVLLKDTSKIPIYGLTLKTEEEFLRDNLKELENNLNCKVVVESAESSKEEKARNAWPGKPAIIIR